jgi:prepilin-type N-terminal cleavage/methylation domain-containing protein
MGTTSDAGRTARARGGFTLIELVVVIAIIALLVGLIAAVGSAVLSASEVRLTQTTLQQLDTAMKEWETLTQRKLTWGVNGVGAATYEVNGANADGVPHVFSTTEILRVIGKVTQIRDMLAQIESESIFRYDSGAATDPPWLTLPNPEEQNIDPNEGAALTQFNAGDWDDVPGSPGLAVLDAWGKPIRAIHPGRVANPAPPFNDNPNTVGTDGTIFIESTNFNGMEEVYGVCRNRQVTFVSAGPDGKFGSLSAAEGTPEREATKDNVYSTAVDVP